MNPFPEGCLPLFNSVLRYAKQLDHVDCNDCIHGLPVMKQNEEHLVASGRTMSCGVLWNLCVSLLYEYDWYMGHLDRVQAIMVWGTLRKRLGAPKDIASLIARDVLAVQSAERDNGGKGLHSFAMRWYGFYAPDISVPYTELGVRVLNGDWKKCLEPWLFPLLKHFEARSQLSPYYQAIFPCPVPPTARAVFAQQMAVTKDWSSDGVEESWSRLQFMILLGRAAEQEAREAGADTTPIANQMFYLYFVELELRKKKVKSESF